MVDAGSGPSSSSSGCAGHSRSSSNTASASAAIAAIAARASASAHGRSVSDSWAAGSKSTSSVVAVGPRSRVRTICGDDRARPRRMGGPGAGPGAVPSGATDHRTDPSRLGARRVARAPEALLGPIAAAAHPARYEAEDGAAAAAEAEDPDHLGDDAGLDRRLRADLGLAVRGRLRAPAADPRDGSRDPAPPRGCQRLGADVHPLPRGRGRREVDGRRRGGRGAGRARGSRAGHARHLDPARDLARDRERVLAGARLRRLLHQPVQPAAGAAARRRPRDGGALALGLVRWLRGH